MTQPQTEQSPVSNPSGVSTPPSAPEPERVKVLETATHLLKQAEGWQDLIATTPPPIPGASPSQAEGGIDPMTPAAMAALLPLAVTGTPPRRTVSVEPERLPILSLPELEALTAKALRRDGEAESVARGRLRTTVFSALTQLKRTPDVTIPITRSGGPPATYLVGVQPERTQVVTKPLTPTELLDYVYRNTDLLSSDTYAVGIRRDPDHGTTTLEIRRLAPTMTDAWLQARHEGSPTIRQIGSPNELPVTLELQHTGHQTDRAHAIYTPAQRTGPTPDTPETGRYTQIPLTRLYDATRDPDGILASANGQPERWEAELQARGYLGYWQRPTDSATQDQTVVLLTPYPSVPLTRANTFDLTHHLQEMVEAPSRTAAKAHIQAIGTRLFAAAPMPRTDWILTLRDWVPRDLWATLSPTDLRTMYAHAQAEQLATMTNQMPPSLPRLLTLHHEQNPYVKWDDHIRPVLQQWVGDQAPVLEAALHATHTATGYRIPAALTVMTATQTAETPDTLAPLLTAMKVSNPEPFLRVASDKLATAQNPLANARTWRLIGEQLHLDLTANPHTRRALTTLTRTLATRTNTDPVTVRNTLLDVATGLATWTADPARTASVKLLNWLAGNRRATWRATYTVPELPTTEATDRLGLITVLTHAALTSRTDSNLTAALTTRLHDAGILVPPSTRLALIRALTTWVPLLARKEESGHGSPSTITRRAQ